MIKRLMKMTGLALLLVGISSLLSGAPAQAGPPPPGPVQTILAAAPAAQDVSLTICAGVGTATMPDGTVIDFWGYGLFDTFSVCVPQLPGPVLGDPATTGAIAPGNTVEITLVNQLPVPTSVIFPGQTDMTSTATGGIFIGEVAAAATETYSFTAGPAGTYLYESGRTDEPQVAMGLYGALIVGAADPFVDEVIVLSEIDPLLNADVAANPATFTYDLLNYNPTYWLLNGRAYPDTQDDDLPVTTSSQPYSARIDAAAGETVRVRYVNAGGLHHSMSTMHDIRQVVQERDADGDPNLTDSIAVNVPSGQTTDVNITVPASASDGDRYPLFNRQMYLTNGAPGSLHTDGGGGGMLTFIEVGGVAPPNVAPTANAGPDQTITLPASATLAGSVNDPDNSPGPLTALWTVDSGPGTVTFVDDTDVGTSASFSTSGVYVLRLTADDGAATASDTVTITVNPPLLTMHVGDLDGSTFGFGGRSVVITVHDGATHAPVSGATVSGAWAGGVGGSSSCTTGGAGTCTVLRFFGSVTYTVTGITLAPRIYVPGANHDVDGGTSGTSITGPPFPPS